MASKSPHRFYTVPAADSATVQAWLDSKGLRFRDFYASFVNYCITAVARAKNPTIQGSKSEEVRILEILSEYPADASKLITAMEWYQESKYNPARPQEGVIRIEEGRKFSRLSLFHS